jgi:hypothetical protein
MLVFVVVVGLTAAPKSFAESSGGSTQSPGMETNFSLGAEVFGLAPYPLHSQGLRLGYFMTPTGELELTYVKSATKVLLTDFTYAEYGLNVNIFTDSELYWGVGITVRDVELKYNIFTSGDAGSRDLVEREQAIAVNGHLGLQFSYFDRLTIGSDVVTVSAPVYRTMQSHNFPADADEREDDPREFPVIESGFKVNMQFLRTFVKVRI